MDDSASLKTLQRTLDAKYQVWLEIRAAGIETMFVRMHLREMRRIIGQIEQVVTNATDQLDLSPTAAAQIEQLHLEFAALDRFIAARQQHQSMLECLNSLPEFRLLEIDQALNATVDPDELEDFDME